MILGNRCGVTSSEPYHVNLCMLSYIRHYLAQLHRKMLCYSKSAEMWRYSIRLLIHYLKFQKVPVPLWFIAPFSNSCNCATVTCSFSIRRVNRVWLPTGSICSIKIYTLPSYTISKGRQIRMSCWRFLLVSLGCAHHHKRLINHLCFIQKTKGLWVIVSIGRIGLISNRT